MLAAFERLGVLLEKTNLPFENQGVFNPCVYQEADTVHMFYRAVAIDQTSSIGYCRIKNGTTVQDRSPVPILVPEHEYEKKGVEDPRITKIADTYYMIYVAYDGFNARLAYATSKDLRSFVKHGIISPNMTYHDAALLFNTKMLKTDYFVFAAYMQQSYGQKILLWEKDAFLMPRKFNGKYAMMHRILPDMQMIFFETFEELQTEDYWRNHLVNLHKFVVIENTEWFEGRNIGGGCPAIQTPEGWLIIYHGVHETNKKRTYAMGAALLDIDNPLKLIAKLREPLLFPEEKWEVSGAVRNTVFPTAAICIDKHLYVYYGAADERIAVARIEFDGLLQRIKADGLPPR